MLLKKAISCFLSLSFLLSSFIPVFAEGEQNITNPDQSGKSDITATVEASNFDITVPLGLPLYLHADGSVTTATDAKIENNSQGPVIIKNVKLTPADNWKLASFTDNYKIKKVNSNELGFQIMNENVLVDGSVNMKAEDWSSIPGNGDLPLNYDGKVPVRNSSGIMTAANLELTFDWYKNGVTVYPDKMYLGKGFTRNIEVLSKPENNVSNTALAVNPLLLTAVKTNNDSAVTFTSSNPDIASIDQNGNVTGLKQGTTVITATSDGKEDNTMVTVLNVSVSATEGGIVTFGYDGNDKYVFAATANNGYSFVNWTDQYGNIVSTDTLYETILTDNISLRANFKKNNYNLKLTLQPKGSGTVTGEGLYAYGENVDIKAVPSTGYKFYMWSDGDTNTDRTINIKSDLNLVAIFIKEDYTVSIINDGHGSAYIDTTDKPVTGTYHYGDQITLINTPDAGYHFVNYTDSDGNVVSSPYTVTGPVTIKANFEADTYTITANNDGNGTVSGGKDYKYGEQATLIATPNDHYHFTNWTDENNTVISDQSAYTFTVTDNIDYTAHFSIDQFTVTLTADTGGSITGAESGTYNYGTELNFTAVPNSNYEFIKWSDNDTNTNKTIIVTDNINLVANFKHIGPAYQNLTRYKYNGINYDLYDDGTAKTSAGYLTDFFGTSIMSAGTGGLSGDITISNQVIDDNGAVYTVTGIGEYSFYFCDAYTDNPLTSVTIPDSVTSIGENAFSGCSNLTNINVDQNNNYYVSEDGVLFDKNKTELIQYSAGKTNNTYIIPNSVTLIDDMAFLDCISLTNVVIPDSVTSIGSQAFEDCDALTNVDIGNSVTSIGNWAFSDCDALTDVDIGNSVTSIGWGAFESCGSLKSITIPDSVMSIGDYAFDSCNSLASITIPNSVTSIGNSAFGGCNALTNITIPDSVTSIGNEAFSGCDHLTNIDVDLNNNYYSSKNGVLFNRTKTELITYPIGKTNNTYIIPNSVVSIDDWAFEDCNTLTDVTISDSVTSIGEYAFENCTSLTNMTIPDSVTSIGDYAFDSCNSLASITIPNSVTYVGYDAFYNWESDQTINIEGKSNYQDTIDAGWYNNSYLSWDDGCDAQINYLG